MNYQIEKNGEKAAYLQLYEHLKADIVSGAYRYGSKLPSKRTLAEETQLSVMPVMHAYALLCDEGYIESRQRSGYYVIYREKDFLTGAALSASATAGYSTDYSDANWYKSGRYDATDSTDYPNADRYKSSRYDATDSTDYPNADRYKSSRYDVTGSAGAPSANRPAPRAQVQGSTSGDGEKFPYTVLARTMRRVLSDYGERILVKSPGCGCPEFRQAIASYLARSIGIFASPAQIVIGSGAEYLYSLIVQLLGASRGYALEDPSYEKIRRVYEANGAVCDMLKLGKDGIRSDELERTRATALHITPFNNFPSGVSASASKKQEYIHWARTRDGFIIEDNYAAELTLSRKNEDTVFSLAGQESVLYLNTFSRTIAPSVRVGYLVLPENLQNVFAQKLGFYSCTVPTFEQYVLTELLETGDFERHINRVRRLKRRGKTK